MTAAKYARQAARRLFKDCFAGRVLDEDRTREIVMRIIEAKRRRGPSILVQLERLVRLERERSTATITSAVTLPGDLRTRLAAQVTRRYGSGVTSVFREDPAVIGGLRLKVGSDVYDGTILGRLAAIEHSL